MQDCRKWGLLGTLVAALAVGAGVSAQIDPKNALLERTGWEAIAAGRGPQAAEAFREALVADPKNARLHLGAGIAAFLERRDADARESLERALELDPGEQRAREVLGLVLYRLGDLAGAIRTYETVVAASPDDKQAAATLERWRRETGLRDRMQQAVGSHFTVSFEGPEVAELASRALESLDLAYWRVGDALGTYPVDPVPVVLYSNEQFRDITRSPDWAAAAYDGTIRVPVRGALEKSDELGRVLAHEFTHALVRSLAARGVPVWLNEGLATALESSDLEWAATRLRESGAQMSLGAFQTGFGRLTGAQAQVAYAFSALSVRRLLEEAGGFAVANLIRDLGDGVPFEEAFAHRIQRSFADFQAGLVLP